MSVVIKGSSNVNLDFTTGGRITGDFSNATIANRVAFQTSTANSTTSVGIIPSGTGTSTELRLYNNSDPTNSARAMLGVNSSDVRLVSGIDGTGTNLPMTFYTGGSERVRIDTSGNVGIGTSTPESGFKLHVVGNAFFQPTSGTVGKVVVDNVDQRLVLGAYFESGVGQYSFISSTNNAETGDIALRFRTGTTDRMTITNAGDVGIGTSSPNSKLQVNSGTNLGGVLIGFGGGSSNFYDADLQVFRSGNATERARIDSSGNLLVGVTSGAGRATISAAGTFGDLTTGTTLSLSNTASGGTITSPTNVGVIQFGSNAANSYFGRIASVQNNPNGSTASFIQFLNNVGGGNAGVAEAMRIDISNNLLVGTTSVPTGAATNTFYRNASGAWPLCARGNDRGISFILGAAEGYAAYFERNQSSSIATCGYIYLNTNNTTTYATSSDYRLKENVAPMTGALEKVAALKPCTYTWKSDGSSGDGFIAHELQEVCPQAVHGVKDAVDADGKPQYQGVDTSFLVATLTAAIQELKAMNDTLTARVAQLEAK